MSDSEGMSHALNPEDQETIDSFPMFLPEDVKRINDLFTPYIFYEADKDGSRECQCTRCGQKYRVERWARVQTPEWREIMYARHNEKARCLHCGRGGTMKSIGKCKSGASLEEWVRVIVFHVRDSVIYGQAYFVRKEYWPGRWRPPVEYLCKAIYTFRPGEATGWRWRHDWTGLGIRPSGTPIEEGWDRMRTACEPFTGTMYGGNYGYLHKGYHTVGLERLEDSFLTYCLGTYLKREKENLSDGEERFNLMKWLSAAAQHPQIEMLAKMGLNALVNDLVIRKRKLTREIKWGEKDPRKAFGLTGPELKEFCAIDGDSADLRWYKMLRKAGVRTSFREIAEAKRHVTGDTMDRFFRACAAGCGVRPMKAVGYIHKQRGDSYLTHDTIILWVDYVEAAKYCGYALDDPQVLMPKRLKQAHDGAVETELQLRNERELQDDGPYQKRYQRLMDRYGFEDEQFFIRAPSSSREIIAEGKVLNHCVGRYAGKHAKGRTNILFLRRKSNPFLPAWTIEIRGTDLIQVQGRSDRSENRPKGEAKVFLDQWLEWVKAGSRRDKEGQPVQSKDEGSKTA